LVLLFLAFVYSGPFQEWKADLGQAKNFLKKINIDEVNKIKIEKPDNEISLVKVGNRWKVDGTKDFYLRDNISETMISTLRDAVTAKVEIVSENPEKKGEFNTNENGAIVELMQGETVFIEFNVGKAGSDYLSSYISQPDRDETYLVKANLNAALAGNEWYDKTIFDAEKEKISKIRFQYPTREFTVEKVDEEWLGILPYKFSIGDEKLDEVLSIMSSLIAADIPEQTFDNTGLGKNNIIIQTTGEGVDNILMIGDAQLKDGKELSDDTLYFAKQGSSDNIYLVTKGQRDELDKAISDLR